MPIPYALEMRIPFGESFVTVRMGHAAFMMPHCWEAGSHSNADHELHILLGGECSVEAGRQRIGLCAGEGIWIRKGVFHHPCSIQGEFTRFAVNLMPESPALEQTLFGALGDFARFTLSAQARQLCQWVLQELEGKAPFYEEALRGCLLQLLAEIFRKLCPAEPSTPDSHDDIQQRIVTIDQFFALWMHPVGTEEKLAQQLNLSRRQLGRLLQRYYGMSFREKLRQSRMEYAGSLLRTTEKKISEICLAVGYREEAAFFRAFRNYYHMTPGSYRTAARKEVT